MKQVCYPESWERRRLKFVADVKTSNVDKHIHDDEIPIRLCNYTDVYYNRVITEDMELSAGSVTPHELNRFGLRRGQVLMTKDSESWDDIAVPAYVSQDMPEVVCGYHLAMVEPLRDEIDGEFFCWAAQTDTVNDHYKLEARGVTRFGLGHYALKNVEIGFPSTDRQRAINAFLREKTAEIDDLIAKKRSLLALLAEKRSALITRAVTKGLDPNAPMKPSGIGWLGDIPAHWEARRLRFIAALNRSRQPKHLQEDDAVSFVPMTAIGESDEFDPSIVKPIFEIGTSYTPFKENDVLVAKITPCFENGKGAIARGLKNGFAFGTSEIFVLTALEVARSKYIYLLTKSRPFRDQGEAIMTGAGGQKRISSGFVKDFLCPLPPLEEQEDIELRISEIVNGFEETSSLVNRGVMTGSGVWAI